MIKKILLSSSLLVFVAVAMLILSTTLGRTWEENESITME